MPTQQKKILVLADGSERSMQTVQYVANFLPPTGLRVVLFHVFKKILFVPLIITGQFPLEKKIMLAIDGSESSHRMVEFVVDYLSVLDYPL